MSARVLLILIATACFSQDFDLDSVPHYIFSDEVTSSGAAVKWTLQVPANSERNTYIRTISVFCEAGCEAAQVKNGTTATSTEVQPIALNLPQTPVAKFYKNSDSTGGSSISPISIPAQSTIPLSQRIVLRRSTSSVQNYSVSVLAASGKIRVYFEAAEKGR